MVQHILLDLDETLFDFRRSEEEAINSVLIEIGVGANPSLRQLYSSISESQWRLLETQQLDLPTLRVRRFEILLYTLMIERDASEIAKMYEEQLSQGIHLLGDVHQTLQELSQHYQLYAATNGISTIQRRRIAESGLEPYFTDIFISQELGYTKPHVQYYHHIFEVIRPDSLEDVLMVGDNLSSDILGGHNAGISTVWINPTDKPNHLDHLGVKPTYQIASIHQLPQLLS